MMIEEKDWRRLCALVAEERDPQRLSELVEQLIEALDTVRLELERIEGDISPTTYIPAEPQVDPRGHK